MNRFEKGDSSEEQYLHLRALAAEDLAPLTEGLKIYG